MTTTLSRPIYFKTLPENYSAHTTISLFLKNHFCSFGCSKSSSSFQVQKPMRKIALPYKPRSMTGNMGTYLKFDFKRWEMP